MNVKVLGARRLTRILGLAIIMTEILCPFNCYGQRHSYASSAAVAKLTIAAPASLTLRWRLDRKLFSYIIKTKRHCRPIIVTDLVSRGASPNARAEREDHALVGSPVLTVAIMANTTTCAIELLKLGATAGITKKSVSSTAFGLTALWVAVAQRERCNSKLVRALLKHGADPNELNEGGTSILARAILASNPECAQVLIMVGARVPTQNEMGLSALFWVGSAATPGEAKKMTRLLLAHGADPHLVSDFGTTPIFGFVAPPPGFSSPIGALKLLLSSGADANRVDDKGQTPLLVALLPKSEASLALIRTLVNGGADVNWANPRSGKTPLMAASERGAEKIVRYLLKQGAKLHTKDKNGKTALDYAREKHRGKIVKLLKKWEVNG